MLRSLIKELTRSGRQSTNGAAPAAGRIATTEESLALMRIDAAGHDLLRDTVTLLLPTVASRAHFLQAALLHLADCGLSARVIIADHSEDAQRHVVPEVAASVPQLDVTVVWHPPATHFLERMARSASEAKTRYVVIHADDDYMLVPGILASVRWLEAHPAHVACQGRTYFMRVEPGGRVLAGPQRCLSREEDSAAARVVAQCSNFTPTFYAVTRTETFIAALSRTLDFTDNVIFWQYLSSCFVVAQGHLRTLDDLYYLRLDNPGGWRATLVKERDPSHWPYLLMSSNFSAELARFKLGLLATLDAPDPQHAADLVDDCCLALIRRALGLRGAKEEAEQLLLERLQQAGTPENGVLLECGRRAERVLKLAG
jgi:glycosyltransferase domain-containing protein